MSNTALEVSHRDELKEMLEGMTKGDLIKYGRLTYGLSLTAKYTQPDLVNAILSAASKFKLNDRISVGDHLAGEELTPGTAEVQIHRTELNKGMGSCIGGLNGKMFSLPIGPKFWCPIEFVGILNDAIRLEYDQDWSSEFPKLIEREVHAYPYTVHRVSQHTTASQAKANRSRGLRGRPEGAAAKARTRRAGLAEEV